MEQLVITGNQANAPGLNLAAEIVGLEVNHSSGYLRADICVREGGDNLFSVYSITGQLRFRKRILHSGAHRFSVDLRKGVYVATLISGKNWTAKRITVN